jgi:hypothetical protein
MARLRTKASDAKRSQRGASHCVVAAAHYRHSSRCLREEHDQSYEHHCSSNIAEDAGQHSSSAPSALESMSAGRSTPKLRGWPRGQQRTHQPAQTRTPTSTPTSTPTPTTAGRHDQLPGPSTHPQTTRRVSYARERGGHTRAAEAISNSAGTNKTPQIINNDRQVARRRRNRSTPTGTDDMSIWGPPN